MISFHLVHDKCKKIMEHVPHSDTFFCPSCGVWFSANAVNRQLWIKLDASLGPIQKSIEEQENR